MSSSVPEAKIDVAQAATDLSDEDRERLIDSDAPAQVIEGRDSMCGLQLHRLILSMSPNHADGVAPLSEVNMANNPRNHVMLSPPHHRRSLLCLAAVALSVSSMQAVADSPASADDWQYAASLYFFAPGINGSTASGSDMDVSFDTLLDNLNMTFMGAFEASKGKWSALADVLYLNVGANGGAEVPLSGPLGRSLGIKADASVKVRGWVLSALGGYKFYDRPRASVDVIAGLRYLELKASFGLGLQGRSLGRAIESNAGGVVWDAVVGVRGRANLTDDWFIPFHLDVGTGDSDLTWQAFAGVGYRFDWGDVSLTYRHLDWDLGSSSAIDDLRFSGPQLTATFRF